jgi:hypothetical protein
MENKEWYKIKQQIKESIPILNKVTEGYGFKYTTYSDILATISPILAKYSVTFDQKVTSDEKGISVKTVLYCHYEKMEDETLFIPWERVDLPKMTNVQSMGGVCTYLKRYGVTNILGIHSEKDADDKSIGRDTVGGITEAQVDFLMQTAEKNGHDINLLLKKKQWNDLSDCPAKAYGSIFTFLSKAK